MKKCFKCGESKETTEFYKHKEMADGYLGKCKSCTKRDVAANYRKNREYYIGYELKRGHIRNGNGYIKRDRSHSWVYSRVQRAIKEGSLSRIPCEICGWEETEAHHENYNLPYQINWLCRKHHLARHGKIAYTC